MLLQRQVPLLLLLAPGRQVREEEGDAAAAGGGEEGGEGEEETETDLFYPQTSLSERRRRESRNSRYARTQSDAPAASGLRVRAEPQIRHSSSVWGLFREWNQGI